MSEFRSTGLVMNLFLCSHKIRNLLSEIDALEINAQLTSEEKLWQIKIIREEISKVNAEIDNIKKEIRLISAYGVN